MKRRKYSMATVLLAGTISILLVVTIAISVFFYVSTRRVVQNNYVVNYNQIFSQLNQQLSDSVNRATQLTAAIKNNSELLGQINLARSTATPSERLPHEHQARSILKTALGYQPWILNAGIYMEDLQLMLYEMESSYMTDFPAEPWFDQIMQGEISEIILPDYQMKRNLFRNNATYFDKCFVYARAFNDGLLSHTRGVLLLAFDQAYLSDLLSQTDSADGSIIALLDQDGHSLFAYGSTDSRIIQDLSESTRGLTTGDTLELGAEDRFLIRQMNKNQPWELVALIPEKIMYNDLMLIRSMSFTMSACMLAVGVVLMLVISRIITRPFNQLSAAMAKTGEGTLQLSAVRSPIREVDSLGAQYDNMVQQVGALMKRNSRIEKEKRLSEIEALKAQINPHFVYNTLDSIRWMALMQKAPLVAEMLSSMVRLLKLTNGQKNPYIRVSEEFEQVSLYANIVRFRYNSNINITFTIDEDLENARTLGMLVQPIVENSFAHGFKNFERDGNLHIHAYAEDDTLVFCIADDGIGMTLEEDKLPETPKRDGVHLHTGIGISNVNSRIRLNFGDQYGVRFRSEEGVGTTVLLTQPLTFFEEGESE